VADIPKLTKNPDLLAPAKARRVGPIGKLLLVGGTVLAGLGAVQATPTNGNSLNNTPSVVVTNSRELTTSPAPLVLKPANVTPLMASQRSHSSHSSHRSHSSHHSSSF
jgi:hypothetical protein